jgi:RNA polymerase sigma-70 factor (ECF subfamily)
MDPNDREMLVMRHFEELTNREAALSLGISESAACNRYVRALGRLKQVLRQMPGGIEGIWS